MKQVLHVHGRLSKTEVTGIEITVLSLFPYSAPQLGGEALRHFLLILTLAETTDMILVDAMSQPQGHEYSLRVGFKEGFAALRPAGVPPGFHEGINPLSHTREQHNERAFVLRFLVSFRGSSLHSDGEWTRT